MSQIPLVVLDLVPIVSGSESGRGRTQHDRAGRAAERAGYHRYWFAEHHLNPGVAGSRTPVVIALVAGATSRIRLGSGRGADGTPDSPFGRRAVRAARRRLSGPDRPRARPVGWAAAFRDHLVRACRGRRGRHGAEGLPGAALHGDHGLLIPETFTFTRLLGSPRFALHARLLQQAGADHARLHASRSKTSWRCWVAPTAAPRGSEPTPVPGEGANVEVWILGSSGGESASVAGELGLPFARQLPREPGRRCSRRPTPTGRRSCPLPSSIGRSGRVRRCRGRARRRNGPGLAAGYGLWVRSIRTGAGRDPFPSPGRGPRPPVDDEERALVADRVDTQFVGSPETVVAGLEMLPGRPPPTNC